MNKRMYDIVLLSVSCLFFVGCGCVCTKRGEYVKTDTFKYKRIAEFERKVFPIKIKVVDEQNCAISEQYGRMNGGYDAIPDKHFATGNNGAGFFLTNDIKLQQRKKYKLYVSMKDLAGYKITLFLYKRTTVFFPLVILYTSLITSYGEMDCQKHFHQYKNERYA